MLDIARRTEKDRCDLFRATAQAMRVHEAIVEKDFWVCWALDYLFSEGTFDARHSTRKGGEKERRAPKGTVGDPTQTLFAVFKFVKSEKYPRKTYQSFIFRVCCVCGLVCVN